MNNLKEAFKKIKEENYFLNLEINSLKNQINQLKETLLNFGDILKNLKEKANYLNQTQQKEIPTTSFQTSTQDSLLKPLKPQNLGISIGNQGASTDRQTDRQTDKLTQFNELSSHNLKENKKKQNSLDYITDVLNSLDNIKKELRIKFKRLTNQEFLVFSTIYQLDQEKGFSTYKEISEKLHLTQSSIRDYVGRLVFKGISIIKKRKNNKEIHLFISENLKKITSLNTILQLRSL